MSEKTAERLALEARYEAHGKKVPGNIGDEKLKERVEELDAEAAKAAADKEAEAKKDDGSHPKANAPAGDAGRQPPQVAAPTTNTGRKTPKVDAPKIDIFEVIDTVRHNGKRYKPGDPIELDVRAEAPGLINAGVIADPNTE